MENQFTNLSNSLNSINLFDQNIHTNHNEIQSSLLVIFHGPLYVYKQNMTTIDKKNELDNISNDDPDSLMRLIQESDKANLVLKEEGNKIVSLVEEKKEVHLINTPEEEKTGKSILIYISLKFKHRKCLFSTEECSNKKKKN